jgi:hypothetical protein
LKPQIIKNLANLAKKLKTNTCEWKIDSNIKRLTINKKEIKNMFL